MFYDLFVKLSLSPFSSSGEPLDVGPYLVLTKRNDVESESIVSRHMVEDLLMKGFVLISLSRHYLNFAKDITMLHLKRYS
jgi:hypothetical protein